MEETATHTCNKQSKDVATPCADMHAVVPTSYAYSHAKHYLLKYAIFDLKM